MLSSGAGIVGQSEMPASITSLFFFKHKSVRVAISFHTFSPFLLKNIQILNCLCIPLPLVSQIGMGVGWLVPGEGNSCAEYGPLGVGAGWGWG